MTSRKGIFLVNFGEQILNDSPQFSHLLTKLNEKLTSEGVSKYLQKHLDLVQQNITQARYIWLINDLILKELTEVVTDIEIRNQEGTVTADERQLGDVLSKFLTFIEVGKSLVIPSSAAASSSLFGLSEEDMEKHNLVKHHLLDIQQIALPILEEKLRRKCEELYDFLDPSNSHDTSSDRLLVMKSHSLPVVVEQKKQILGKEMESLKHDRSQRDLQFWIYYKQLLDCLSRMEILIKDFKLTRQTKMDDITVEWLQNKSDALCIKIRLTQLQILCDTYSLETVKALKKIEGHLNSAVKKTEKEFSVATQSLDAYHAVGTEFLSLVEQFTQLHHEIENRKWSLEQLTVT